MNKIIIIVLITSIFLMGLVSALYIGETFKIDLSNDIDLFTNYTIEGNTSYLNVSIINLIATIKIPNDYEAGSFNISFNGYKSDREVTYIYVGGGGTTTVYQNITKNNTIYKDKNVYVQNYSYLNNSLNNSTNPIVISSDWSGWKTAFLVLLGIAVLILIIFIVMIFRNRE